MVYSTLYSRKSRLMKFLSTRIRGGAISLYPISIIAINKVSSLSTNSCLMTTTTTETEGKRGGGGGGGGVVAGGRRPQHSDLRAVPFIVPINKNNLKESTAPIHLNLS